VRSLFVPHSHDAADSIDTALEKSNIGTRTVIVALVILAITTLVQAVISFYSGSAGLLSDTLHNAADALTALPLWLAFRLGRKPPTKRFTYGFDKAEDVAGLFVIGIIALSALAAGVVAVHHLLHQSPVTHLPFVALGAVVGVVGNETVALYRIRTARHIGSAALEADGLHARADGIASGLVLLGALGAAMNLRWADPAVGLLIALTIVIVLVRSLRSVGQRLLDAVDPALATKITEVVSLVPGVCEVTSVQARFAGHRLRAEVRLSVAGDLSVTAAHDIADLVHHRLLHEVPNLTDAIIHVDPHHPASDPHPHSGHHL
jgi:cation diffusion facilitator family transporter